MLRWFVAGLLLWLPASGTPAPTIKLAVAVRHAGGDPVGVQFAYRLRDAIRSSRTFFLTDERQAVAIISLISIDRECAAKGNGSSVAVLYLDHEAHYMMGAVHTVGRDAMELSVADVLTDLDQHSRAFR